MLLPKTIFHPVTVIDTTLRDGEQAPGVAFSLEEKLEIAQNLCSAGIKEIEAGIPAAGSQEFDSVKAIVELGLRCRVTAWCRAVLDDIKAAADCGVDAVHFSLPVSDIQINALGKTRKWVLNRIAVIAGRANRMFDYVSLGAQDASRADSKFLDEFIDAAYYAGIKRIRFADTVGIWNPLEIYLSFSRIRSRVSGIDLGFHGHNDLGMATANALAAIQAGATAVDVTVNGLGERAGNTALEQLVMAAKLCLDFDCGIDTEKLCGLSKLVAQASGRELSPSQPITGSSVFSHESGIHVNSMIKDDKTYEPFAPDMIGRVRGDYVLGKHSGRSNVIHAMAGMGISVGADQAGKMLDGIKCITARHKRPISPEELLHIYKTI